MIARLIFALALLLQYHIWRSSHSVLDVYLYAAVVAIFSLYLLHAAEGSETRTERKIFYVLLFALLATPMAGFVHAHVSQSRIHILDEKIVLEPVYEAPFTLPIGLRTRVNFSHDPMLFFRKVEPSLKILFKGNIYRTQVYDSAAITSTLIPSPLSLKRFIDFAGAQSRSAASAPHALDLLFSLPTHNRFKANNGCMPIPRPLRHRREQSAPPYSDIHLTLRADRLWWVRRASGKSPLNDLMRPTLFPRGLPVVLKDGTDMELLGAAPDQWEPEALEALGFRPCIPAQRCIARGSATEQTREADICQIPDRRKQLHIKETCYCLNEEQQNEAE